jgi:hypothetical protein
LFEFPVASESLDFAGHVLKSGYGGFVRLFFEFELVFHEGDALGVFGLDFSDESKDDGEESKVHLGGVTAAVRHSLG